MIIVALDIEDAVAKIRTGPPSDEPEDISWPTWAGVLPIAEEYGALIPDEYTPADMPVAPSIASFLEEHEG